MLKPPYALPEISSDWLAAELDGHVDLGSRKEVTKLTRRILRHPRPTAAALWHAVRAIGTMHLPLRWRGDVESAFTRLTKREQRRANEAMLGYYYMIWEPELALQFCVIPRLQSAGEMMFAMELLLHFNKLDQAKTLQRRCLHAIRRTEDACEISCLAEALASFYLRTGNWKRALEIWTLAPRNQPLARNAAVGRAEIFIVGAVDALNEELRTVAVLKKSPSFELEISLPGIEDGLIRDMEKDLLRLKRGLERLLPQGRRQALGL